MKRTEAEQQLKAQGIDTDFFDDRLREAMRDVVKAASLNVRALPTNPLLPSISSIQSAFQASFAALSLCTSLTLWGNFIRLPLGSTVHDHKSFLSLG